MKFGKILPASLIQSIGKVAKFSQVKKTTRLLIPFCLVIFIFFTFAEFSISKEVDYLTPMGVVRMKKMHDAPDFILSDLEGKKRSLRDFKGKFVMLNFWATW
ncbi:MAG: redoxin domain-containing protein [Deltaproteobacteria bacterium]|nr:redoxin domain-containing protein [Deltaproteobacteria bacterium]